jgi:hypothetical protein
MGRFEGVGGVGGAGGFCSILSSCTVSATLHSQAARASKDYLVWLAVACEKPATFIFLTNTGLA